MANPDRPQGAKPHGKPRSAAKEYVAGATVYPGDLVRKQDDGKVDPATASQSLIGVAASYASGDGEPVLVWDDPDQEFVIQADGADIDAQTDFGLNYNIVATAGSSDFRESRMELDSDTGATDSSLPLRLLSADKGIDNALGAQVNCVVKINAHQLGSNTEGL
jgi:hypothetical protein